MIWNMARRSARPSTTAREASGRHRSLNGTEIVYSVLVVTRLEMFVKEAGSSGNGKMLQTGLDGSKQISDVSPNFSLKNSVRPHDSCPDAC